MQHIKWIRDSAEEQRGTILPTSLPPRLAYKVGTHYNIHLKGINGPTGIYR